MQIQILTTAFLATLAIAAPVAEQSKKPVPDGMVTTVAAAAITPVAARAAPGVGMVTPEEAEKLRQLSVSFGSLQSSLAAKYPIHYCTYADYESGSCDSKCAYYLDMSPFDAMDGDNCLDNGDKKDYVAAEMAVKNYKEGLEEKYGKIVGDW